VNTTKINEIYDAIREAEDNGLLSEDLGLSGFSGRKLIGALQRLSKLYSEQRACYLEVGVFQGLTLFSVAKVLVGGTAYGIDNFVREDPRKENLSIIKKHMQQLDIENICLINMDYEDALGNLNEYIDDRKVGVYFVDGPHDYRSQLMCLELAKPFLADNAVIVVDDSNYQHIRQANRDFLITNPQFKLVFEAYTECHPNNMSKQERLQAREGWWNGVNVILHDNENRIAPMYPPTQRDRRFFVNDHSIHSAHYAACAPQIMAFTSSLLSFNIFGTLKEIVKLFIRLHKTPSELKGQYKKLNTFSSELTESRYNPSLSKIGEF
jgi:hypothetical protein